MREMIIKEEGTRFYGCLSMLLKGVPLTTEVANSVLSKPVVDSSGKRIGIIDRVDIEHDEFSGVYIKPFERKE